MKERFYFLGLVFLFVSNASFAQSSWSPELYANHTYQSFENFPPALQEIIPSRVDIPLLNAALFYETNRQRVLQKMSQFMYSNALEKSATMHSNDMARLNFFSHTSTVRGRETMVKRINMMGITNAAMAENIADSFILNHPAGVSYQIRSDGFYYKNKKIRNRTYLEMAQAILDQWMNSPGHRKNILSTKVTYLGTGSEAYGSQDKLRIKSTQNFSSKLGPEASPSF